MTFFQAIPAEAAGLEFFRVENASEWVVPAMFAEFLRAKRVQTRCVTYFFSIATQSEASVSLARPLSLPGP